jgi:hypothetical protein
MTIIPLFLVCCISLHSNRSYAFTHTTFALKTAHFKLTASSAKTRNSAKKQGKLSYKNRFTCLRGIDFDAIEDDEECDFITTEKDLDITAKKSFEYDAAAGRTSTIVTTERRTEVRRTDCIELPTANADFSPEEVVTTCMNFLQNNDDPRPNVGLEVCFNFSSDSCRAANGGSLESFLQYAKNPVFQTMVNCHEWAVLSVGPEIAGTNTRGAMKTVLVKVIQKKVDGARQLNDRKFLWTLMKERRPPRQGFWLVHECISVENAFATTL